MTVQLLLYPVGALLAACLALVLHTVLTNIRWRHKYSFIPGPPTSSGLRSPVLGSLIDLFGRKDFAGIYRGWVKKYGPVMRLQLGSYCYVLVADPDAARQVLAKSFERPPFFNSMMNLMHGRYRQLDSEGLVQANGEYWRWLRMTWQKSFSAASLAAYVTPMDGAVQSLMSRLDRLVSGGQAEVDVLSEMGRLTLAVVGSSAYGVDLHTMEGDGSTLPELVWATKEAFRTLQSSSPSKWALPLVFAPVAKDVIRLLANTFPDASVATQLKSRDTIVRAAQAIIDDWKASHARGKDSATAAAAVTATATTATAATALATTATTASANSFMGALLDARDKSSGQALTDSQIIAQAFTFILAGFETTASALAFAVFCLARNPAAEQRLVAEVAEVLGADRDTPITPDMVHRFSYAEACINEAMRMYPPAHATSRQAEKPTQVLGHTCPAGTRFLVPIIVLHRDPDIWPRATEYLPERFLLAAAAGAGSAPAGSETITTSHAAAGPGSATAAAAAAAAASEVAPANLQAFMPFGVGSRQCIGAKFAIMEAKIALVRLVQRFHFELAPGTPTELPVTIGLTMTPRDGVMVRLTPRQL